METTFGVANGETQAVISDAVTREMRAHLIARPSLLAESDDHLCDILTDAGYPPAAIKTLAPKAIKGARELIVSEATGREAVSIALIKGQVRRMARAMIALAAMNALAIGLILTSAAV